MRKTDLHLGFVRALWRSRWATEGEPHIALARVRQAVFAEYLQRRLVHANQRSLANGAAKQLDQRRESLRRLGDSAAHQLACDMNADANEVVATAAAFLRLIDIVNDIDAGKIRIDGPVPALPPTFPER